MNSDTQTCYCCGETVEEDLTEWQLENNEFMIFCIICIENERNELQLKPCDYHERYLKSYKK